jgi:hypothetical protein
MSLVRSLKGDRYEQRRLDESPEFKAVRDEMKTLISHGDLAIWEQK